MADQAAAGSLADEDRVLVPIRMVESLVYCPRQAWYRFTLGDDQLNIHMERGLRRHATFDQAEPSVSDGEVFRHLPVYAPDLGVQGVLDEVVITPDGTTITEYKASKARGPVWVGIVAQLAVQCLALQEHAASERWLGPPITPPWQLRVYFSDSRQYRDVNWDVGLEAQARDAVRRAHAILAMGVPPPGLVGPRCTDCQHEPICLPYDTPAWLALIEGAAARDEAEHGDRER